MLGFVAAFTNTKGRQVNAASVIVAIAEEEECDDCEDPDSKEIDSEEEGDSDGEDTDGETSTGSAGDSSES